MNFFQSTTRSDSGASPAPPSGRTGLKLIAVFKFLKALALIAAGLGTLGLLNSDWNDAAADWLQQLALTHGKRLATTFIDHALSYLSATTPHRLIAVASGAFLYGSVFLVEGVGLWRCKRWAEYLTLLVTASLLPFEILALYHRLTLPRAGTLALNLLVIGYLVWRLWVTRGRQSASPHALA